MTKEKAISDEQIIAAILGNRTIKEAAAAVDLSERAIYDRMRDHNFLALYANAKTEILRAAVFNINKHTQTAIETIAEIMEDKENNPAIRLQAAQTILNSSGKFIQRLAEYEAGAINATTNAGIMSAMAAVSEKYNGR